MAASRFGLFHGTEDAVQVAPLVGDLYNLVYDPAFLVHAWERVSTNKGAKTPGVDKATAARIETWIGVEVFLGQIRDSLKSGGKRER